MKLLEIQKLCKTYGSGETAVQALKNVSFSVRKGEYVAIVGESGSGKSTLLNMIGALDTPTSGKVLIDGRDTFAMKEKKLTIFRRRNIGFIFQAFNLIPELTVEQNMIFPLLLDYQKPDQHYLEELLAVLNLRERRSHLPSQLSGGQRQRVHRTERTAGPAQVPPPADVVQNISQLAPLPLSDYSGSGKTAHIPRNIRIGWNSKSRGVLCFERKYGGTG